MMLCFMKNGNFGLFKPKSKSSKSLLKGKKKIHNLHSDLNVEMFSFLVTKHLPTTFD